MRALSIACSLMLLFCAAGAVANTVTSERTEVTLTSDKASIHKSQNFWLALHIKMKPGWHTYWLNPGDSGLTPELKWTLPKGFVAGDVQFPSPDLLQEGAEITDYGYEGDVWLPVAVTAPALLNKNAISIFMLHAHWLVCKDVCIPESGDFSLSLPTKEDSAPSADASAIEATVKALPAKVDKALPIALSDGKLEFIMPLGEALAVKGAHFFPADEGLVVNNAQQHFSVVQDKIEFSLQAEKGTLPEKTSGLVSLYLADGTRKDFAVSLGFAKGGISEDVIAAVIFAMIGGLILNLMPCVFPILALKALAVAKKAEKHPAEVKAHGLAYSAGVILSFLGLALMLIAIQAGGKTVGWGYQMQSPAFVLSLAIIFFLVGLNLAGYFEIPAFFSNVGGNVGMREGLLGSFATGALAVLVATPCTAPFMAPAIGFAITQGLNVIVAVFTGLGIGLSAPFLLISFYPQLIKALPRPGAWMQTFKQFVAFPMFGCTLWLLWVLAREVGQDATFALMLALVIIAFALWLAKMEAKFTALLVAALAVVGMIECIHFANSRHMMTDTEAFSTSRLEQLRAQGDAVFVDATADWCITCKVNESVALSSKKIRKAFAEKHITFMVADWTHGEPEITHYLQSFGRAGVPLYIYYPKGGDPIILPQVLTESIVRDTIK